MRCLLAGDWTGSGLPFFITSPSGLYPLAKAVVAVAPEARAITTASSGCPHLWSGLVSQKLIQAHGGLTILLAVGASDRSVTDITRAGMFAGGLQAERPVGHGMPSRSGGAARKAWCGRPDRVRAGGRESNRPGPFGIILVFLIPNGP
jgi:hypothetical protein